MNSTQNNFSENDYDFIDLGKLFSAIWDRKIFISTITSLAALLSVTYALSLPNIYTSTSLLAPASSDESLTSKLGNFSSLGSLAGISLPSGSASKSQEAMQRIKSFDFFKSYFLPNIQLENLMAVDKWVLETNTIVYNDDLFDTVSNKWIRETSNFKNVTPSDQEAFKVYKDVVSLSESKKTSFVSISAEHQSPVIAKKWVDIIVYQINESMRKLDSESANNSISFLKETAQSTNVQSIRDTVSQLLENQMQTLMLTSSNDAYIYKTIDSSIVPEEKSKPSRALICIFGTLMGGILSIFMVLIMHLRSRLQSN